MSDPFDFEDLDPVAEEAEEDSPDVDDVIQGSDSRTVRLAESAGYLIVEGPGAGSVVSSPGASTAAAAAPLPTRDQALEGSKPLLLVHRPYQNSLAVPRLLAASHAAFGVHLGLGTVSKLAGATELAHQSFAAGCGAAAVKIVDPEACRVDSGDLSFKPAAAQAIRWAPYLGGAETSVADYLDLQRTRGANVLLTPGRALDGTNPEATLDRAIDDGDAALAQLRPGERLALNLVMSPKWLTTGHIRDQLFAELVDQSQFDVWYVRVQLPAALRAGTQPTDEPLLRGYKRLAELAVDEERRLLLPQTGLTGWLMLGFGAAGLGTGTGGQEQLFKVDRGGGNGKAPRIERYFEAQLLHTIERSAHAALAADTDYFTCDCPYCPSLWDTGAEWNHVRAGLHQVYGTARVIAAAAAQTDRPGGLPGAVRRAVRSAIRFAAGKGLTGLSDPTHLPVWDRVL